MKNIVILFGLPVLAAMTSFAGNVCTWSGKAGNGSWKDAGNWDTKPVDGNGDTVVLLNAGAEAITIENDIGAKRVREGVSPVAIAAVAVSVWDGLVQAKIERFLECDLEKTLRNTYEAMWGAIRV